MLVNFPAVFGIEYSLKGNPARQIAMDKFQREGMLAPFTRGRLQGSIFQPAVVMRKC